MLSSVLFASFVALAVCSEVYFEEQFKGKYVYYLIYRKRYVVYIVMLC